MNEKKGEIIRYPNYMHVYVLGWFGNLKLNQDIFIRMICVNFGGTFLRKNPSFLKNFCSYKIQFGNVEPVACPVAL